MRECAFLLKDNNLIAKLSAGDLIAIEAKYHAKCLVGLYNRARQSNSPTKKRAVKSQVDLDEPLENSLPTPTKVLKLKMLR